MPLICLLIVVALFNAVAAAREWRALRWSVTVYWLIVGAYWIAKGIGR